MTQDPSERGYFCTLAPRFAKLLDQRPECTVLMEINKDGLSEMGCLMMQQIFASKSKPEGRRGSNVRRTVGGTGMK